MLYLHLSQKHLQAVRESRGRAHDLGARHRAADAPEAQVVTRPPFEGGRHRAPTWRSLLNPYFVLMLALCRRWIPDFRLGSLLALVLPLSIAFFLGGAVLTAIWVAFEVPVGPGAAVSYMLPDPVR